MPTSTRFIQGSIVAVLASTLPAASTPATLNEAPALQTTPQAAASELLAVDRQFAAASARTDLVAGISAMFTDKVIMPLPNAKFAWSAKEATDALRTAPDAKARATWTPIRAGVSADGQHGFTYGFMTVTNADGSVVPGKYMSYWVREADGWKVAAYKRRRSQQAGTQMLMAAATPARMVLPTRDAATIASHYRSVVAAEHQFSTESQTIGLGAAFQKFGLPDAVNMGPPTSGDFVLGAVAIGKSVAGNSPLNEPSPVTWGADTALVASSGDLGITFGVIRENKPSTPPSPGFSFYTIWYRTSPTAPWRYIAE